MRDGNYSTAIDVLYINSSEHVRVHAPAFSRVDVTTVVGFQYSLALASGSSIFCVALPPRLLNAIPLYIAIWVSTLLSLRVHRNILKHTGAATHPA